MKRIKLIVAYDGTDYHGWQTQNNATAVELVLCEALEKLLGEKIQLIGASRTDAGVHARGNVAVFDTESRIPPDKICFAVNQWLPKDIRVTHSEEVSMDFHPRYIKSRKRYEYVIENAPIYQPMNRRYAYFVYGKLDVSKMQEAADYLVGEHDFKCFCSAGSQVKTTVRTIYDVSVTKSGTRIVISIEGNGFLYNMVRIIAGTLVEIGKGFYEPESMKAIIESKDRAQAGATAPANGLTLANIQYASKDFPSVLQMRDGRGTASLEDWQDCRAEILSCYEKEMYGRYRSGEKVSYKIVEDTLNICVSRNGESTEFPVSVFLPDRIECKKESLPVMLVFETLTEDVRMYALEQGYAVIEIPTKYIAEDAAPRVGGFYKLYPYGAHGREQTGVLMAWAWGASKVLDALENGAAMEWNLDVHRVMITGVSRWGKAASVAGAFDERFWFVVPVCSGAGGMAAFRYCSEGQTYNLTSLGGKKEWTIGQNEPLSCLQSEAEQHWFNDAFLSYKTAEEFPFDQHFLAAACASAKRYLFIVGAFESDMWTNPPGMYKTFLEAKKAYDVLGIGENIGIHFHLDGHALLREDLESLFAYADIVSGRKKGHVENFQTCVIEEMENQQVFTRI